MEHVPDATLDLSPDDLLTTTRAVRRRLDLTRPVALSTVRECVRIAQQAPCGSNFERAHFVVVTDPELRQRLADLYQRGWGRYRESPTYASRLFGHDPVRHRTQERVARSAEYLADHLHEVPVHIVPCIEGRPSETAAPQPGFWGSVFPALWSLMLAARARGLGTVFTTQHLAAEEEAADLLGIPFDRVTQCGLVPLAHVTGQGFRPAARRPVDEIFHVDGW